MIYDSSTLSTGERCNRKMWWRYIRGMESKEKSDPPRFGHAIHEALFQWYMYGDPERALAAFHDNWSDTLSNSLHTHENGEKLLRMYFKKYAKEPFEVIDLERKFALPIESVGDCPFCGARWPEEPIITEDGDHAICEECKNKYKVNVYCGRFDAVIKWGDNWFIMDHKTASRMGPGYFKRYRPNLQFTGYCWAAEQLYGVPFRGVLVNVLYLTRTKMDLVRDISSREPFEIVQFVDMVTRKIREYQKLDRENMEDWKMNWTSCGDFGGCEYRDLCLSEQPERLVNLLFNYEPWSPLHRKEEGEGETA